MNLIVNLCDFECPSCRCLLLSLGYICHIYKLDYSWKAHHKYKANLCCRIRKPSVFTIHTQERERESYIWSFMWCVFCYNILSYLVNPSQCSPHLMSILREDPCHRPNLPLFPFPSPFLFLLYHYQTEPIHKTAITFLIFCYKYLS